MGYLNEVITEIKSKNKNEIEFIQAVFEVFSNMEILFDDNEELRKNAILERLIEPERSIQFKVPWEDDLGKIHVNRGYRVQFNSAIGPYKGGLRFNPNVNLSIMKFLAFEQTLKNALTGLPIGGAKGGCDFDPKGKSNAEIKRFCNSFMLELYRHIGPDVDVPAGDMGVGAREIGFMYGQYRRIMANSERGVLTGKAVSYGGSLCRKEATGYGLVYFLNEILARRNDSLVDKRVIISGSGNVAIYAAEKVIANKGRVIAMSDSQGYIIDDDIDMDTIKLIKEVNRSSLSEYPELCGHGKYQKGSVYDDQSLRYDIALPCATQNEININRAKNIVNNGCHVVAEGANMPNDNEAIAYYLNNDVVFAPGKAANAGGVATSALEMTQNSMRYSWSFEEVDAKLHAIMVNIHRQCVDAIKQYHLNTYDYVKGANIAALNIVLKAMIEQGDY